jgi:hypothetical protein
MNLLRYLVFFDHLNPRRRAEAKENFPVQDSLFRFSPPAGVEVIEENQITQ